MTADAETRYIRQLDIFTAEGQRRIGAARIAVLGLGGLGSHVCQQLAYLGAKRFVLVDDDLVDETNLNRLVGATGSDVGIAKNVIMERLIKSVQPTAEVDSIVAMLPHDHIDAAISSTDLIMGCFDNDYPRLMTTALASEHRVPYVDAASGINVGEASLDFGGRVVVAGIAKGCLNCMNMLDQDEIRRAQMNDAELEQEAKLYGVSVESLRGTGPSVVAINGVIASLAVVEAMHILSRIKIRRDPVITYRGVPGWITRKDPPTDECYYCSIWNDVTK